MIAPVQIGFPRRPAYCPSPIATFPTHSRRQGGSPAVVSWEPRRYLAVAPLIGDKRCYGEVTARLRRGPHAVWGRGARASRAACCWLSGRRITRISAYLIDAQALTWQSILGATKASKRCWGSKSASRAQMGSARGGAWSSAAVFTALMRGSEGAHSEAGRTGLAYQPGFRAFDAGIEPPA